MTTSENMARPVIGIILDSQRRGTFSHRPHYALRKGYFETIERSGGLPVGIPTLTHVASAYVAHCDGFIVAGGDVAFPAEWYIDGRVSGYAENPERLAFEVGFLQNLLSKNIPVLAICHGMQILAHVLGGRLSADISAYAGVVSHRTEQDKPITMHGLDIVPGSKLAQIFPQSDAKLEVNSHHKEGVVSISERLITAYATDGVIEAIASPDHMFVHGVQWHPELLDDALTQALLQNFMTACRERKQQLQ